MKVINLHKTIDTTALFTLLNEKLNPLFHEQKHSDINFIIEKKDNTIEISQPDLYEGFLFRMEPDGMHLNVTRSEHYVDDVNSITVESILNGLFEELSGDQGVSLTLEG